MQVTTQAFFNHHFLLQILIYSIQTTKSIAKLSAIRSKMSSDGSKTPCQSQSADRYSNLDMQDDEDFEDFYRKFHELADEAGIPDDQRREDLEYKITPKLRERVEGSLEGWTRLPNLETHLLACQDEDDGLQGGYVVSSPESE